MGVEPEDRPPEPGRGAVSGLLMLVARVWGGLEAHWRGQGRKLVVKLERTGG